MYPSMRSAGQSFTRQVRLVGRRSTDLTRREVHALAEQMMREHYPGYSAGQVFRAVRRVLADARRLRPRPSPRDLPDLVRAELRDRSPHSGLRQAH